MNNEDLYRTRATPIEEVAERLGIRIVRHKALCPFHDDKHPSLHFNVKRNRFCCYACGARGNVIDLVMRYNNFGFKEAAMWIDGGDHTIAAGSGVMPVGRSGQTDFRGVATVDVEYLSTLIVHPTIEGKAADFLFVERKIDPKVAQWCGLTSVTEPTPCWRWGKAFYDAPSLLIPYRDVDGRLLSVQGRYLGTEDKPRFRFPRGSHVGMYNKPMIRCLTPGDELWITEGPSDCWAMMSAGRKAVAIPSATTLTMGDIRLINNGLPEGVTLHMMPDNDRPGMELFQALKRHFPNLKGHVLPDGVKDYGEYWKTR